MQTTEIPAGAYAVTTDCGDASAFKSLQARLPGIWRAIQDGSGFAHTSVVVPSLSVDPQELRKIEGASFYEERLLFSLMRLRHPHARVLYVTSQPVHPDIVDYYLHLLAGVPASHARRRLGLVCVHDTSEEPLSRKILRRPRLIRRIRDWIGDPQSAYLTCNNSTELERTLALEIGIPLNGVDPDYLQWGTKSGSRSAFAAAGVDHPHGVEHVRDEAGLIDALLELAERRPGIRKAVVKFEEGFSGEGNAIFSYPESHASRDAAGRRAIAERLRGLAWAAADESYDRYMGKFHQMGGVVEEFIEGDEVRSPSVQMRITPSGEIVPLSSHEQILGGANGQVYVGCRFPADDAYRATLHDAAMSIARVLGEHGVVSRFGIDFIATRERGGAWRCRALEINLRMTGTTHPFMALEFLTGGAVEPGTGLFRSPRGEIKYYVASDNLKSPYYRGLLPEDLMDIVVHNGLDFRPSTETGALFHMIGGLSQYGKLGVTCIGNSPAEAEAIYSRAVSVLDAETGASQPLGGRASPLLDRRAPRME